MRAQTPRQVVELFAGALSAGDLDGALSLYEPDAAFAAQPGAVVRGLPAIREALAGFVSIRPTLSGEIRRVVEAGDTALVVNDWELSGAGPDGEVAMAGRSADVVRRQPDGRWLIVIDDPWGGTAA